jgi:transposase
MAVFLGIVETRFGIGLSELRKSMHQDRDQGAFYQRVEVITGARRRREWSDAEKARIVAESFIPDANVSEVARRNGVSRGLLNVWRREARKTMAQRSIFARVEIENAADTSAGRDLLTTLSMAGERTELIEVSILGATVRVPAGVDAQTLTNVFVALRSAR